MSNNLIPLVVYLTLLVVWLVLEMLAAYGTASQSLNKLKTARVVLSITFFWVGTGVITYGYSSLLGAWVLPAIFSLNLYIVVRVEAARTLQV